MKKELAIAHGYTIDTEGNIYDEQGNEVKTYINPCGWLSVRINNRIYTVARLVADTFICNPDGLLCVKCENGDRTDCNLGNIKRYYSGSLADEDGDNELPDGNATTSRIEIIKYDLNDNAVEVYNGYAEAMEAMGYSEAGIRTLIATPKRTRPKGYYLKVFKEKIDCGVDYEIINRRMSADDVASYKVICWDNDNEYKFDNVDDCCERNPHWNRSNIFAALKERNKIIHGYWWRWGEYVPRQGKKQHRDCNLIVARYDSNGNLLKVWRNVFVKDIAAEVGTPPPSISYAIKSGRSTKGYYFRVYEPEDIVEQTIYVEPKREPKQPKPKGKPMPNKGKLFQVSKDGEVVGKYKSIREAAKALGYSVNTIYSRQAKALVYTFEWVDADK